MQEVFLRVAHWNSLRYEQVYDKELAIALLREEYKEWLEADKPVDKLDALCDIVYVTLGIIWKADLNPLAIGEAGERAAIIIETLLDANEMWPAYFIGTYLDVMQYDKEYSLEMSVSLIMSAAMTEMTGLGLTPDECIEALLIVCDSNDSKSIKKTASNVKANGNDKGEYFVPPESRLTALLEKANGRLN